MTSKPCVILLAVSDFCLLLVLTLGLSAAGKLLAKEPELKANFSRAAGATSTAKSNKVARFLPNPEPYWGPKPKHGRPVKVKQDLLPLEIAVVFAKSPCYWGPKP